MTDVAEHTSIHRQRVFRAVHFQHPDRPPMRHNITGAAVVRYGQALLDILEEFPDDFGTDTTFPQWMELHRQRAGRLDIDEETVDEWGCRWRHRRDGMFGMVVERPLETWSALETYRLPPVPSHEQDTIARLRRELAERRNRWFTFGAGCMIWERMQFLRGDANILMDIAEGRPEVERLADMVFDYARRLFEASLETGVDCVAVGDDWGNQDQLRIRPEQWRRIFKPRYRELFQVVHERGGLVRFHSCGYILDIIPDLIEIGVDILNVQSSCMPLQDLAEAARGRVCLEVDIDRQYQMPHGTPDDVRRRAEACYQVLALPEGGFIWLTEIGPDVPLENVRAYYEAACQLNGG